MNLKRVACLFVVLSLLSSYVPATPLAASTGDCSDDHGPGQSGPECGYMFHCPMLSHFGAWEFSVLSFAGRLLSASPLLKLDDLVSRIFHPPKAFEANITEWGERLA